MTSTTGHIGGVRVNIMDMPPYLLNFSNEIQPPFGIQESEEDSPRTYIWAEPQPFLDVSRNKEAAEGSEGVAWSVGFFPVRLGHHWKLLWF